MTTHLARYEPLRDLATLRDEMERIFMERSGAASRELTTTAGNWSPDLDIEETDASYVLHVELPGVKPDDISVSLDEGVLTVTGERRFYEEKETEGFRRIERRFGSFYRAVRLPGTVDPSTVDARYDDGILTVTVPKTEATKPQRIAVQAG